MKIKNQRELLLLMCIFAATLIIIGQTLNYNAIINNECRMPVQWTYDISDNEYVFFEEFDEVNSPFLSDIIGVKGKYMFSIGDVLVYLGIFLLVLSYGKFAWIELINKSERGK